MYATIFMLGQKIMIIHYQLICQLFAQLIIESSMCKKCLSQFPQAKSVDLKIAPFFPQKTVQNRRLFVYYHD